MATKKKVTIYKSAVNGRFVTKAHALRSPKTTYKQTVKK
jgi:hypothetical protein